MATYFNPRQEIHNSSGAPYSGALAYFYITNTDTLKSVYTNEGLTIAHANPVVADAAGHWAPIFLNTDVAYKVVVRDSSGNVVYTDDVVRPVPLYTDFSAIMTHAYRAGNSPVRYGAIGDGVADEWSYVQSAITNATGTVDLLGLTYRCDSQLTVPSNRRIINGVLDFSSCAATDGFIKIAGSIGTLQDMSSVAANASALTSTLTPTAVAGDLIRIESANVIGNGTGRAEFHRVRSISSNTINLQGLTSDLTYTTTPKYGVVTPKARVVIEGVEIRGALSGTRYGIYASYCSELRLSGVTFTGINTAAVWLQNCYGVKVHHVTCRSSVQAVFVDGCEDVVIDGLEDDGYTTTSPRIQIGKATTGTGQANDVVSSRIFIGNSSVRNYSTSGTAGIAAYVYSRKVRISKCSVVGAAVGVWIESLQGACVTECNIDSSTDGIYGAVPGSVSCTDWDISGNVIYNATGSAIKLASLNTSASLIGLKVARNIIRGLAFGISFDWSVNAATTLGVVSIDSNVINMLSTGTTPVGIRLLTRSAGTTTISDLSVRGNDVRLAVTGGTGISLVNISSSQISGIAVQANNISSTAGTMTVGILCTALATVNIANNIVRGTGTTGISYTVVAQNCIGVAICGNTADGQVTGVDVNVSNTAGIINNLAVTGNVLVSNASGARCVYLHTTGSGKIYDSVVVGNSMWGSSNQPCVDVSGGAGSGVSDVSVVGNASDGGTYQASFANIADANHSANSRRTVGTATSTGASVVDGTNRPV